MSTGAEQQHPAPVFGTVSFNGVPVLEIGEARYVDTRPIEGERIPVFTAPMVAHATAPIRTDRRFKGRAGEAYRRRCAYRFFWLGQSQ